MHNFFRALRQAGQYWPSLVFATACSFAVAALWGANIGAFYPILEVTIKGKSMHEWIDEESQTLRNTLADIEQQIASKEASLAAAVDDDTRTSLDIEVYELKTQQRTHQAKLKGYNKMLPWVQAFVPESPFNTIAVIVAVLMLSTLVKHVCLITNEYLVGRVALDLSRSLRMQVFSKAMHMQRTTYAEYGASGFIAQMTHTTDMLSAGLMATLGAALREPLKVFSCLLGAFLICPRLLLMSVLVAPVVGWLLVTVTKQIRGITKRVLGKATNFHAVMHESLGNIQTVQAYQMEAHEEARFAEATQVMRNFGLKYIFYSSLTKPIIEFLGIGMLGTTIVGGAYLVLNKETHLLGIPICDQPLSVSALLIFFGMLVGVSDPLRKLSAVYGAMYSGFVAADSLYTVLDQPSVLEDPENPRSAPSPHKVLSLRDVEFSYNPETVILEDVSLEIPYGSTIAVVGHNGSGKSTLINLLCRFYDPIKGSLQIDGVDYREMRVHDVRKRIALVNQQTELFNDTVAYNIRYGNAEATDAEVQAAAREAHAAEFIESSLDEGYDSVVGANGSRLSGGQRQRIALARALLCDPEILILDEATSQIDMHSEQLIRESLAAHRGRRTMIIITHREKLLELADEVYVVENRRLVKTSAQSLAKQRDAA